MKSPMKVVLHKNRQFRTIIDLYVPVYPGRSKKGADPIQASVNETIDHLPPEATAKEISNIFL